MTELHLVIRPEMPVDADPIERLHERAFGPGRFARTAYRLREGVTHPKDLSFTALVGTLLVGSIRMSPIVAGSVPALMLGPITVDPAFEGRGIGAALIGRALDAARGRGPHPRDPRGRRALLPPLRLHAHPAAPARHAGPREPGALPRPRTRRRGRLPGRAARCCRRRLEIGLSHPQTSS
jgi:GNAT superfamily N-acetyltransferase